MKNVNTKDVVCKGEVRFPVQYRTHSDASLQFLNAISRTVLASVSHGAGSVQTREANHA
ncbi:hypothetical protein [Caballeronia sordidicola]|uniref:hypothetical protein n=1 Tax=Caballeronia sordidicola TaxID=196367 RepID=UPI0015C4FF15|nr:hypothetical protein [Caballeronia sordidicola]